MVFCQDDHVAGIVNGRLALSFMAIVVGEVVTEEDECNWCSECSDRKVVDTREQPEDGAADDKNGFSLED